MQMSEYIRHRLALAVEMPYQELTPQLAYKIIKDRPVNLMKLVKDSSPGGYLFPTGKDRSSPSSKLAMVLNAILLMHFDSVDEFRAVLVVHDHFYEDIWSNDQRQPRFTLIRSLITEWNVDVNFLYGHSRAPFTAGKAHQ